MKILSVSLQNFASYERLDFDFQNQGLTLIHGATGSGKSTLCDAIPWILFGTTAKGGAVNEVLSWNAEGPTRGWATIETGQEQITVIRSRNPNDLYYNLIGGHENIRGKDLSDTQKLINNILGVDAELYLAGAYFHEFSQTAQFFQTTAKNRRAICEQLVDLSLPVSLQEKAAEKRKHIKNDISKLETEKFKAEYEIDYLLKQSQKQRQNAKDWEKNRQQRLKMLNEKLDNFEETKAKRIAELRESYINDLKRLRKATVCSECGAPKAPNLEADSPIKAQIARELETQNTYAEQIVELEAEVNPFTSEISDNTTEIELLKRFIIANSNGLKTATQDLADLVLLSDVVDSFRAVLISNTISNLEASTNKLLNDHFDAEIRVTFTVEDADKLDVSIFKDGNSCVYTQLSKGQRCLLKLCFGVSVMREVTNHHGARFHQIFFDEALDGLDSDFKLKALSLINSLEIDFESIFLVEHSSEIKASCSNSYYVQLINGHSVLDEKAG